MRSHTPVLLEEVLAGLAPRVDGVYVDATFGRGGHTGALLARLGSAAKLYALDRDPAAIAAGHVRFAGEPRLVLYRSSFGEFDRALKGAGYDGLIDGVMFDLGVSSPQLDDPQRGFSFMRDGPLDMRMDPDNGISASEWLAQASENEIARTVSKYGEERYSRRIARAIVQAREERSIASTAQLVEIIAAAVPRGEPGKHVATRTFQALRIQVNAELAQIELALSQVLARLAPGARLCVISFHSLEDRIVKRFMRDHSRVDPRLAKLPVVPEGARPVLRLVSKARRATAQEVQDNPRARSAVLRVAERIGEVHTCVG